MRASKIFYLLNFLIVVNLIIPCIHCSYDDASKLISLDEDLNKKKEKKKKIILYSSLTAALIASVAIATGLGIYFDRRHAKKIWTDEKYSEAIGKILKDAGNKLPEDEEEINSKDFKKLIDESAKKYNKAIKEAKKAGKEVDGPTFSRSQIREIKGVSDFLIFSSKSSD